MQIYLKNVEEKHLEEIMNWRKKPEITRWMYTDPAITMKEQLVWYKNNSKSDKCKYWVIEADGVDIGLIALVKIDKINKNCHWVYYIVNEDYLGKGIGKTLEYNIYDYVFQRMEFNKLSCEVFEENEKVIMLHKKCGQKIEGILRNQFFKYGEYHNIVIMAIQKIEWDTLKNNKQYDKIIID